MSGWGHSRPNWAVSTMSAFLPIATELRTSLEVRFVPNADINCRDCGVRSLAGPEPDR